MIQLGTQRPEDQHYRSVRVPDQAIAVRTIRHVREQMAQELDRLLAQNGRQGA